MIFPLLSFLATASTLTIEGALLVGAVTGADLPRVIRWSLGYPTALLVNALVFFLLHLVGLPLTAATVGGSHLLILSTLTALSLRRRMPSTTAAEPIANRPHAGGGASVPWHHRPIPLLLSLPCTISLAVVAFSAISHAVFLPTSSWDSLTNWHMRSQQMFEAQSLLTSGVAKPQYPVLLHATQIVSVMPLGRWSDTTANVSTLLLSAASFWSVFLLLRRSHGALTALVTCTLLTTIPLAIVHLGQGYADIHVVEYTLLAALLLDAARTERRASLLLLSGLLCAAAAWTKLEGLYLSVVPWLLLVISSGVIRKAWGETLCFGLLPLIALTTPWPLFTLSHGLGLSPHGSRFGWHGELLPFLLQELFDGGSFGVHWYAILFALLVVCLTRRGRPSSPFLDRCGTLTWGVVALGAVILLYLTNETEGLLTGRGFSRVMLLPTLLLTQALSLEISIRLRSANGTPVTPPPAIRVEGEDRPPYTEDA